jgi:small neutral amino acid transporter SnatA (MarC family)
MLALFGLSTLELLGIIGSVSSGAGGIVAAIYAVRRAKQETRAKVEHECLERIARLREQQPPSVGSRPLGHDSGGLRTGGDRVIDERTDDPTTHDDG